MILRDPQGRSLNESDRVFVPTGLGAVTVGAISKVDLGVGSMLVTDAAGTPAPAQAILYLLLPIPIPPTGIVPLFKVDLDK